MKMYRNLNESEQRIEIDRLRGEVYAIMGERKWSLGMVSRHIGLSKPTFKKFIDGSTTSLTDRTVAKIDAFVREYGEGR